jgi:lysophospholipase L1-like esterase
MPPTSLRSSGPGGGRRPLASLSAPGTASPRGRSSANWVNVLQQRLAPGGYQFVNAGIDGGLAWNVLQRIDDIIRCQPDIVTLQAGTNDVNATYGVRQEKTYRRQQHIPHTPTLDWYVECVDGISPACSRRPPHASRSSTFP